MYLPDCPFEVCTTNRYTILTHEACVVARRFIKQGEPIRFLSGIQVEMTEKEEEELSSRTDFSIVISSRRKRPSLFLGPARFANHDCDSNARLSTSGPHGIHIVARKSIAVGEEITVQYGDNYFGEDNCECLCGSCEKASINGWDPRGPILHESDSEDDESETEEEQKPSPPPKNTGATASGSLKRKRGDILEGGLDDDDTPRKRDRAEANNLPSLNQRNLKMEGDGSTQNAQEMMANWFEKRRQEDLQNREERGLLQNLQEQFNIKRNIQGRRVSQQETDQKQSVIGRMFGMITGATARKVAKLQAEIDDMNNQTAAMMRVDVSEVPQHYRRSSRKRKVEEAFEKEITSPGKKIKNASDTETSEDGGSWKVTDKFSRSKPIPGSARKDRHQSNLRKVLNADDDDDDEPVDIFEVPDSPVPDDRPNRGRGRPRKQLPNTTLREDSNQRLEAAQHSTDTSSNSSVFSHEGHAGEVSSSLSSTEISPNRLDGFAAGNICQNIVEMYTSEPSPTAENWDEERKQTAARMQGWARGRLPVRKSSRRSTLLPSPAQAITSIESGSKRRNGPQTRSSPSSDSSPARGTPRTPGDYHLTTALLATTYHRWVECRNCDTFFVQAEAYLTRIACPRCERHSKLYGYHWPKTDREGKFDGEKRVLDHRTIHRFIDPEDERLERKGKRGLREVIRERESSSYFSDGTGDRGERLRSEGRRVTRRSMQ